MDILENSEIPQQDTLIESLSEAEHSVQSNLKNKKISQSLRNYYEGIQENISGAEIWVRSGIAKKTAAGLIEMSLAVGMLTGCVQAQDSKKFDLNNIFNIATATETETPTPTSTSTPVPTPLSLQDLQSLEMTRVAPLTTPGAIEDAIKATSQAVNTEGWKSMVERGFPQKAVDSAVKIISEPKTLGEYAVGGSGNLMHIDGYWVVLTAGHMLKNKDEGFDIGDLDKMILYRPDDLPNSGMEYFSLNEYGAATSFDQGLDFGVIVIPDGLIQIKLDPMFRVKSALSEDDLAFYKNLPDSSYYGIGFPGITEPNATVCFDGHLAKFVDPQYPHTVAIVNNLASGGSSGGENLSRLGTNSTTLVLVWLVWERLFLPMSHLSPILENWVNPVLIN